MRSILQRTGAFRSVAFLGMLGVASGFSQTAMRTDTTQETVIPAARRSPAPEFVLTDVSGRRISLAGYKGRVVLLDFWATTCGGCKVELPWYVEFGNRYRSKGLSLIGLDMYGESPETIRRFMAKWHMDYPVAVGTDALGERFGLREMPLTVLIDRQGRVAVSHAGVVDKAGFESAIQRLLQER